MAEKLVVYGDLDGAEETLRFENDSLRWEKPGGAKTWHLDEIKRLYVRHYIGSVALFLELAATEIVLLRGSLAQGRRYQAFAQGINNLIKGGEKTAAFSEAADRCPKCNRFYPDPRRPVCPRCLDRRSLFKRVLGLTPPYAAQIILMSVLMLASSQVGLLSPYLGGRVFFDEVLGAGGRYGGKLGLIVLGMFGVGLLTLLLDIWQGRVTARIAARVVFDLKTQVFAAMQNLSLKFYNQRQTGALMTRVNNDANHLQRFFLNGLPFFITNSLRLIGIVIVLVLLDWRLAALVFLPVPVIVFLTMKIRPLLWRLYTKRFRASSRLNSIVNDSLSGVRVIKAFGKEEAEIERFTQGNEWVFQVNREVGNMSSTVFPALSYFMSLGALVIWGFGGWRVMQGELTFGTLMTFTGYLGMVYGPLDFMTRVVDWWSSSMNSAQRIFEVVDSNELLWTPPAEQIVGLPELKGSVSVQDVTFGYEDGKPVLEDISFEVAAGEMIGIVGRSGAGKSTLINLISRLYDPNEGKIYIDGVDVRFIQQADLRRQVGMVLQETFLFRGTVFENIAYAKPEAEVEEVIAAAKIANAHEFITKLPDGYETVLGVRDIDLSGGEKQRLAIARAVLHNPRILILDEATAAIDVETERLVQEALERLVVGRTTFAIAHRLSTLRRADRLLVLDRGKLVEMGTHTELLRRRGVYHRLFTTQRKALSRMGVAG